MSFLPNFLTSLRLLLAPVVAWAILQAAHAPVSSASESFVEHTANTDAWSLWAAGLFFFAALTDLFDGWAARALNADSKLGRILDPIADKALVGLPLIVLSYVAFQSQVVFWPVIAGATIVIVCRDLLITVLRMMATDGEGARVSTLAKWKTTAELLAVGLPILLMAAPALAKQMDGAEFSTAPWMIWVWLGLLMLAAALSALTGLGYLTAKPTPVSG